MAKDPAFLFYPGDFQGGTMTMTRHLKGCYIDLLIAQFNSGSLSLEEIRTVLGNDFAAWGSLSKKFEVDSSTGKFFNERLQVEIIKRKAYTDSQTAKGKLGGRPRNPGVNPILNPSQTNKEGGNENGIGNEVQGGAGGSSKSIPPSLAMIEQAFAQNGLTAIEAEEFFKEVEGRAGWGNINNWKVYTESAIVKRLNKKQNGFTGNNSKTGNRVSDQRQSVRDVKDLAREVLRQSGSEYSG